MRFYVLVLQLEKFTKMQIWVAVAAASFFTAYCHHFATRVV